MWVANTKFLDEDSSIAIVPHDSSFSKRVLMSPTSVAIFAAWAKRVDTALEITVESTPRNSYFVIPCATMHLSFEIDLTDVVHVRSFVRYQIRAIDESLMYISKIWPGMACNYLRVKMTPTSSENHLIS